MIVRSKRTESFTIIGNAVLADDRISFRAKGVLVYLLGKPDNWQISERHLATLGHEGVTAVRASLKELEEAGYIRRRRRQADNGRFEWESVVYDEPQPMPTIEDQPAADEPPADEPPAAAEPDQPSAPCAENLSMDEPDRPDQPPCLGFPCTAEPRTENHPMENCAVINTIETSTEQTSTTDDDRARATPPPLSSSSPPPAERVRLPANALAALTTPTDPAYVAACAAWGRHMAGTLTPLLEQEIKVALQTYPPEWIPLAMETAAGKGKRFWGYVAGILRAWQVEGVNHAAHRQATARTSSKSRGYGRTMQPPVSAQGQSMEDFADDPEYYQQLKALYAGSPAGAAAD